MNSIKEIRRFIENPIIHPDMPGLEGKRAKNINGPSLIKVPDWINNPLGKYYLYFAHHGGKYIRMAYADLLNGPWKIYEPGTLQLEQTICNKHIASPDVHVDNTKREIRMYFHGPYQDQGTYRDQHQLSFVSLSKDGLNFEASPEILGPFYLRAFKYKGYYYAIAKNANTGGLLLRSKDGLSTFVRGEEIIDRMRHVALIRKGDILHVYFTRIGDKPERIFLSYIDLQQEWINWTPTEAVEVLRPEKDYEGVNYRVKKSSPDSINKPAHQLRDPGIFQENEKVYLLYSVAGEQGIAIAEITYN